MFYENSAGFNFCGQSAQKETFANFSVYTIHCTARELLSPLYLLSTVLSLSLSGITMLEREQTNGKLLISKLYNLANLFQLLITVTAFSQQKSLWTGYICLLDYLIFILIKCTKHEKIKLMPHASSQVCWQKECCNCA